VCLMPLLKLIAATHSVTCLTLLMPARRHTCVAEVSRKQEFQLSSQLADNLENAVIRRCALRHVPGQWGGGGDGTVASVTAATLAILRVSRRSGGAVRVSKANNIDKIRLSITWSHRFHQLARFGASAIGRQRARPLACVGARQMAL
jgi:hypothetical protein